MSKKPETLRNLLPTIPDGTNAKLEALIKACPNLLAIAGLMWDARDVEKIAAATMWVDGLKTEVWIDSRCESIRIGVVCGDISVFWYYDGAELMDFMTNEAGR